VTSIRNRGGQDFCDEMLQEGGGSILRQNRATSFMDDPPNTNNSVGSEDSGLCSDLTVIQMMFVMT
jgi:hypothetical protein